jgi:fermentation-respiration switch protein FrsA (DUF1100 family)
MKKTIVFIIYILLIINSFKVSIFALAPTSQANGLEKPLQSDIIATEKIQPIFLPKISSETYAKRRISVFDSLYYRKKKGPLQTAGQISLNVTARRFEHKSVFKGYYRKKTDYKKDTEKFPEGSEEVFFDAKKHLTSTNKTVKLNGRYIPHNPQKTLKGVILFSHGNNSVIQEMSPRMKVFLDAGFDVFIYDYRGYGKSKGRPTEEGIYLDIEAAYEKVVNLYQENYGINLKKKPEQLVLYGHSLGSVVSNYLAYTKPVGGFIISSALTCTEDVLKHRYPKWLAKILIPLRTCKLDALSRIGDIHVPILIMHSRVDESINFDMGVMLYNKIKENKLEKQFLDYLILQRRDKVKHDELASNVHHKVVGKIKEFLNLYPVIETAA